MLNDSTSIPMMLLSHSGTRCKAIEDLEVQVRRVTSTSDTLKKIATADGENPRFCWCCRHFYSLSGALSTVNEMGEH